MTTSFWGLVVEPNKLYSQTVPAGFKLSMASLGPQEEVKGSSNESPSANKKATKSSAATTLMIRLDEKDDYALCSLTPNHLNQQSLDLLFAEGENIALRVVGDQAVHLTGYYLPEECFNDDDDMERDEEYDDVDSEDDEELDSEEFGDSEDSEDDSDEEDRIKEITSEDEAEMEGRHDHITDAKELTSDDGMSDVSSEDEEEEEEPPQKSNNKRTVQAREEDTKKAKVESRKDSPKPNPEIAKKPEQSKKDSPNPTKNVEQKPESKKPETKQPEKKTLPSGLIIEDIKVGEGIKAQQGRRVGITYKGTLLTTGKTFDTNKGKALFHFTLGKGEVIKGMEQGVQGMALGGERRITIPSALGYGPKGAPPAIPGDATLVFEIKLEKVTNNNNGK